MKVLIIWWEIPENIFLIERIVGQKEYDLLKSFHNHYIGLQDDPEICNKINDYFFEKDGTRKYGINNMEEPMFDALYDMVIRCDIIL